MKNKVLVEHWSSIDEYKQMLIDNDWDSEDIEDHLDYIRRAGNVDWNEDGSFDITIC